MLPGRAACLEDREVFLATSLPVPQSLWRGTKLAVSIGPLLQAYGLLRGFGLTLWSTLCVCSALQLSVLTFWDCRNNDCKLGGLRQ